MINPWTGEAYNQEPNAANEIHSDAMAQRFGFSGALVPGVTISAYLCHPAVESWGMDWLASGFAHVRVGSPLYDQEAFAVHVDDATSSSYTAHLERPCGTTSATAEVSLQNSPDPPPVRRGDRLAEPNDLGERATREYFEKLKQDGCRAFRYEWPGESPMHTYLRDTSRMPRLLQPNGNGFANMGFVLVCSNWVLENNAPMNPWVHLETHSQNYHPVSAGTTIIAEMEVIDLFAKKGHEFVDVKVILFDERDDRCLTAIDLRAIYRLRGAA